MYRVIGLSTGKVYETGSKAECMRKLQKEYPEHTRKNNMTFLYKETLKMEMKS